MPYCCPHRFLRHSGALTSVYVINRIPSSVIAGLSPFERLYGSTPYSSELLVFGSTCFVLLAKVERDKLSKKKICYLCVCFWVMALNKRDIDAMTQKLRVSRHVTLWEKIPFYSLPRFRASSLSDPESFLFLDPFLNKVIMYQVSLLNLL